ncbi:MAG: ABC transporter ATP-binding protein [Desulfuromonadales bacterium GWD2_61_12]|nr:MAG: ABC transporter ATP-binding protein [Desulfuromonadales bacterium GWC2_61_20]OGR36125.1 MAG: ABC transporter ATP-binding protein [Desulfuromonadales bacterium GWD2_61_12]HAD04882.1 ABC transporter ATP-binding protein [Desulfuromonas sp.]HBT83641.1 ABC transporter ATP-binding protein [Desulfuromonas sp.]
MAFLEIAGLEKNYRSEAGVVAALKGVELQVEEGTFLGVMGPSGSGKSTFLSCLGGLCHPSNGTIRVDGIDLYHLSGERLADFRAEYLGFVFQSFNLIPYLTALENVMLPLAIQSLATSKKRERAEEALQRVGLAQRADHLPSQLSGGEQERVAIARALVNAPPLILADEPTGSLDSATSAEIMALLTEINRTGQTIVMVTHNPDNRRYFHRMITLRDGRIAEDQTTAGG